MRRAAELPLNGPAASDTLAASGGLELPGRERSPVPAPVAGEGYEPIPGEHDHTTEALTPPAIVGSTGFGADLPASNTDPTLDDETKRQIRWEGGGRTRRRSKGKDHG